MSSNLYKNLIEYAKSDYYGFHMPGHKRNIHRINMDNPYSFDITEINGFDNLHNPEGIILQEMKKASDFYGCDMSYFLVNGSTCGNMSAVSAVANPKEKIIVARNCHKSIYNVMELREIYPVYYYPTIIKNEQFFGPVDVTELEKLIKDNQDAKAVVITSPTYEGVVSNIEAIVNIAHKYNMALIVDEAHGAHFSLSEEFPKNAIECGADVVIESLHKTLPSLTQTAILHYNDNGYINRKKLEKYLAMYQSSSPSYVMISSICNCIDEMIENGIKMGENWYRRLQRFTKNTKTLKNIHIYSGEGAFDFDKSKLVIILNKYNKQINGNWLSNTLREKYHLEMEMQAGNYVIAMTSPYDTDEGLNRLEFALKKIDKYLEDFQTRDKENLLDNSVDLGRIYSIRNKMECPFWEADKYKENTSIWDKYIFMYPPGIPLVVPGEIPNKELLDLINDYKEMGFDIIEH